MTDLLKQRYARDLLDELKDISLREANAEHIALKIKGLNANEQAEILTFLRVDKKDDPELIPFLTDLLYHLAGPTDADLSSMMEEDVNIATAARLGFTRAQAYFESRLTLAAQLEPQATELDGQIRWQIAKVEKATKQALLRQLMKRITAVLAEA